MNKRIKKKKEKQKVEEKLQRFFKGLEYFISNKKLFEDEQPQFHINKNEGIL